MRRSLTVATKYPLGSDSEDALGQLFDDKLKAYVMAAPRPPLKRASPLTDVATKVPLWGSVAVVQALEVEL
jgi:hypothetical protein